MRGPNPLLQGENNIRFGKFGKDSLSYKPDRNTITADGYPLAFKDIKPRIRTRDNYICTECGKTTEENDREMDVHHIDENKMNNDLSNLILLCRSCHMKLHHKDGILSGLT